MRCAITYRQALTPVARRHQLRAEAGIVKGSQQIGRSKRQVLAAVTFSHLAQHFYIGISILYPYMMLDLNLSYTQLGIMTGLISTISGFLQMMWSILNRYVSRRLLLGLGNMLMSAGCFVTATASRFTELIGAAFPIGSGQGAQHPVGTSILAQKFGKEEIPEALSIHYGLGFAGNIVSPVILSSIAILWGWRSAVCAVAAVPLITGLLILLYLRDEDSASRSVQGRQATSLWRDLSSTIHMKGAMLVIGVQAFASSGTGMDVVTTYAPLFLKNQLKVGILETSIIYSIAVLGGVVGTILFGRVAISLGSLRTATMILGLATASVFLLILYNSFSVLLVLHLFIVGITSFSFSSLLQAHLALISTPEHRDILLGLFFTIGFGITSVWTALTGFLIDTYDSFTPAWLLRTALGAIAFLLSVIALRQYKNQ
jgi:predicted MFS family arabinose efflux permease